MLRVMLSYFTMVFSVRVRYMPDNMYGCISSFILTFFSILLYVTYVQPNFSHYVPCTLSEMTRMKMLNRNNS